MHSPKQKEFFDENAKIWDVMTVHDSKKIEWIVSEIGIDEGDDILDVGTGTGVMIPFYLGRLKSGTVTALDYSENMIAVARKKFPEGGRLRYVVGDLYDLRDREQYDVIVCYSCYPHFIDKGLALRILHDALRPGGRLVIAHSSSREEINTVHAEGGKVISMDLLPTMGEMKALFEGAGFSVGYQRDDPEYYMIVGKRD